MFRAPARECLREAARESVRDPVREPTREPNRDATQEPFQEPARELSNEGPLDSREPVPSLPRTGEWNYRGRSESEVGPGEPHSAPTGIPAQRSEGFQRFYKAVVSPTHVRVTAGGRIVPNTRGPPSPTSKRGTDSNLTEGHGIPERTMHGKSPVGQIGMSAAVPILPQFIPGYPPGFQPIQAPVSFVPIAFGPSVAPGFPYGQNVVAPTAMPQPTGEGALKDMHNMKPGEARAENGSSSDKLEKVKLTPPEFFDYTKPFFYNGQYLYPVQTAFAPGMNGQMMPVQVVRLPPGMAPQSTGHVMQPAPTGSASPMIAAPFHAPIYNPSGSTAPNPNFPVNAAVQPSNAPPISSIKPSDITRKQIASFKQALKYHEDQLQYNRHQIDEKDMENRIQTLRSHIQRFESTLKTQLEYEGSVLHHADQKKDEKRTVSHVAEETKISPQSTTTVEHMAQPHSGAHERQDAASGQAHGRTDVMAELAEVGKVGYQASGQAFAEYIKRSVLPSDAALAPVFQPRGYASSWGGSQHSKDAHEDSEKRLMAGAVWKQDSHRAEDQRSSSQSYTTPHQDPSIRLHKAPRPSNSRGESNFGVPYLLGVLPKGVNPRTAKGQDYVYNRPLTEAECRARYLYWGQAPKSAVKGLPKFDGKHFYPPSPGREHTSLSEDDPPPRRVPIARPEADYDFRGTKSELDPFRPMTPVHHFGSMKPLMLSEDGYSTVRHTSNYEQDNFDGLEDPPLTSEDVTRHSRDDAALRGRDNSTEAVSAVSQERRQGASGLVKSIQVPH